MYLQNTDFVLWQLIYIAALIASTMLLAGALLTPKKAMEYHQMPLLAQAFLGLTMLMAIHPIAWLVAWICLLMMATLAAPLGAILITATVITFSTGSYWSAFIRSARSWHQ